MVPAAASAEPGVVTTSADGNVDGTLRYEINRAREGETVTFDAGVNPILTGSILIESGITLDGRGSGQTTITGPASNRVFDVNSTNGSQALTISDLTITGGHAPDATSAGGNGQFGGAIEQGGMDLVISRVEFVGNLAGDGGAGTIGRSGGGAGGAGGYGGGGGAIVSVGGTLAITDSSFRGNLAGSGGTGGVGGTNNFGTGGAGGQGGAGGLGGAILTYDVQTSITDTTFSNNQAGGGGAGGAGGVGQARVDGGQGGQGGPGGAGGGVSSTYSSFASTSMLNSTLTVNHAGTGGAGGSSSLGRGAGGEGGSGGGLEGNVNIRSSTIAANSAGLGGSIGGSNGIGGGINWVAGTLAGTIVASNIAGSTTSATANCGGAAPTVTFGLTFPAGTGCPGTVADPLLGPLASNGGPTQTMALSSGSPALDQVPVGTNCTAADQRGVGRPQGPTCDIGAFEAVVLPDPPPPNGTPTGGTQAGTVD